MGAHVHVLYRNCGNNRVLIIIVSQRKAKKRKPLCKTSMNTSYLEPQI